MEKSENKIENRQIVTAVVTVFFLLYAIFSGGMSNWNEWFEFAFIALGTTAFTRFVLNKNDM